MREFLEYLIPKFLFFQLLIIFGYLFFLMIKKRKKIFIEVNKNKIIFLILIFIFIIAFFVRMSNISEKKTLYAMDAFYYLIEATQINLENKFSFICDAPSYPVLLSLFQNIYGDRITLNSAFNSIIGSLTALLIFIFTFFLFKNYFIALISAVIITFLPFHIIVSIDGYQAAASIFFLVLSMLLLCLALRHSSLIISAIFGLCLGFTSQIYYIEIIFLLIALIYIFIQKGFSYLSLKLSSITLIFFIISILPFIILQQSSENNCLMKRLSDNINTDTYVNSNIICDWAKNYCGLYNFKNIYKNPPYQVSHINDEEGHLLTYIIYLFFGKGRFAVSHFREFWSNNTMLGEYNLIYVVYFFFAVFAVIRSFIGRVKIKETILLLLIIFINMFLLSTYYDLHYKMIVFMEIFMIPLVCFGLYLFLSTIFKRKLIRTLLMIFMIIVLISPFFKEDISSELQSERGISRSNLIVLNLDKRCINPYDSYTEYESSCNLIVKNFLNKYKEYNK